MTGLLDKIERGLKAVKPLAYRLRHSAQHSYRRAVGTPRTMAESPNLLPLLIQVLAAFTKSNGRILEEEIDSSLGFLRYDYPEAVYSELRKLFRQALNEQQDVMEMGQKLSTQIMPERKIMLGVQLYDLISKSGEISPEQVTTYYSFMSQLGVAAQAIDIVYQLNSDNEGDAAIYPKGASPLESLSFGDNKSAEVILKGLGPQERLLAFRYQELVLLKNQTSQPITVRGRPLNPGELCRVYSGQRIVLGEQVLTFQDLVYYFNAKKNVSFTQVYVAVDKDDQVELEKSRSRDSVLEIKFGLKVQVRALKETDAVMNGERLTSGVLLEGTLEDKIIFHENSELLLLDLRRRARAMGGRFQLKAHKSEYLVSNNAGLLDEDDILLSPGTGGEVLLKIQCDYENRVGSLEVLQADRPIMVGDRPVRNTALLADGDTIRIDTGQVLRCNFAERIIEEERNIISSLETHDLTLKFGDGNLGLDGVSFNIARGEMVCVMGASGSGKSTLLKSIAGQRPPTSGDILLNGHPLYEQIDELKRYVSYIPQDDAFDEHLTIEENLDFAAAIRAPHLSRHDRQRRIEGKLVELGLAERRDSLVGAPFRKTLSGGERKRLNIGLDMIGSADVYLFDEPTSGLSSKDSEHVIEIIRSMAHNKIVLVTIHQPTSKLFQMFNKALLLDKGGRLVFYGSPGEMLAYFAQAEHQQHFGTELGGCPACGTTRPEFIFDVLETPLRDLSGDIIYEENSRGQLVPARRFSPDYWRDKYETWRVVQDVKQVNVGRKEPSAAIVDAPVAPQRRREPIRWRDEWTQLRTLLQRAFISKLRNRANLLTTIVEAPLLAALIGGVLRYAESGAYTFAASYHVPTYLFLALIVAMFLGLTNSADDIIRDRVVLQRERNLNVRLPYYILAKALTLAMFALVQAVLFVLIGNAVLEIRGMFLIYVGFMFLTAFTGISLGLLISSLVADAKTAANIVPLVLIPQIILGGALIKYEEMNKNLDFVYTIQRWLAQNPDVAENRRESALEVPLMCEFMPIRWSYEALVVAQAKLNPLTSRQERALRQMQRLAAVRERTEEENERLADVKETLALLSALESDSSVGVGKRLERVDKVLAGRTLKRDELRSKAGGVTAERLYVNQKITDLVSKAESEQMDYRREKPGQVPPFITVFFGPQKVYFNRHVSAFIINTLMLVAFAATSLGVLHWSLRRQLSNPRG